MTDFANKSSSIEPVSATAFNKLERRETISLSDVQLIAGVLIKYVKVSQCN